MGPHDELIAIEAIKQLKARYFRGVDSQDWALYRSVFTDDAVFDNSQSLIELSPEELRALLPIRDGEACIPPGWAGIDAFVDGVRKVTGGARTVHYGMVPEIMVHSDVEAEGIWKMQDRIDWADGAPAGTRLAGIKRLRGFGQYHERYRKDDGQWRIRYSRLTRIILSFDRD